MMGDSGSTTVFRRLLRYVRPYLHIILWSAAATLVHAGADAVVPFLMKHVMTVLEDVGRHGSYVVPLVIAVAFPVRGTMDFLATYGVNRVGHSVVTDLRRELFGRYLALPARFFDQRDLGTLISRLTYDTSQVSEGISKSVIVLVRDSLTILVLLGVMIYMSPRLTLLMVVVAPVVALFVAYAGRMLRRYSYRIQMSMGEFTRLVHQSLHAHFVIRIFEGQERARQQFALVNQRNARLQVKLAVVGTLGDSLSQLVVAVGIAVVVLIAFSGLAGPLDTSTFIGFLSALGMMLAPLRRLTRINATFQRAIAAAQSLFATLDEPLERDTGLRALDRAKGHLEYRHVGFRYAGADAAAVDDVSLVIRAGSTVAVVGQSGSGKSTLMDLLARFHDADGGIILLDGHDVQDYRLTDLRRQLSVVSQDVILFDDSIANNIAYGGLAGASRMAVERAAKAAYVTEFSDTLEAGLDSRVGPMGTLLSGGQRQRIAIARALLKDAPVLVLDEATSALDTHSESRIQGALAHLMAGRTTLVVAHRLSTVRTADWIVAMQNGRIVEAGTHEELTRRGGYYVALQNLEVSA